MDIDQANELLRWIGSGNLGSISGFRKRLHGGQLYLPVSNGYSVRISLAGDDTWTVERVFTRSGRETVRKMEGIYCDQVGEIAYRASCFQSDPNWGEKVAA